MANFTILDGLVLMVVAMATVFAVLVGLWGVLVIVRKLLERESNNQPELASNQSTPVPEEQPEKGTIPPEKVALIMSLLVD
ncbi:MAG: OadG family protein, partial [Lactobacillus sp.]|nr:OadG family protein [Lactobacillus sp.]